MSFPKTLPEVLRSHIGGNSRAVVHQPSHLPLNLVIRRYWVIHWERFDGYGDVLHRERYATIQQNPLLRDPLEGYSSGRRRAVSRGLVPPLNPDPCFPMEEGGVQGYNCLDISTILFNMPPPVRLQDCFYLKAETSDYYLVTHSILSHGNYCVDEPLCVLQDPCALPFLPRLGLWDWLSKVHEQPVLSCCFG